MKFKVCKACKGCGHDKGGMPLIEKKRVKSPNGVVQHKHVTLKRGSGCLTCLGRGVMT